MLTSAAFLYLVPLEAVTSGEAFAAQAGEVLFGRAGGVVLASIVIVSVLGSLFAIQMMLPRLYYAMSRDGLFPASLGQLHPTRGTPVRAIALQAVLGSVLVALGSFDAIVAYFIFVTVAFIGLTVVGLFKLRRLSGGSGATQFLTPGFPYHGVRVSRAGRDAPGDAHRQPPGAGAGGHGDCVAGTAGLRCHQPSQTTRGGSEPRMTWIKIIRPEDADPQLLDLLQKTRAMYPPEYATPVAHTGRREHRRIAHADPAGDAPCLCAAGRVDAARPAARTAAPRDDRHGRLGGQPVLLLTGIARRVSA